MKNEVVNKTTGEVTTYQPAREEILKSDIILPYMGLAQGMSDVVKDRKCQLGDIYRSTTAEILGNPDKSIEAIFFHYPKANWIIEQKQGNRFQYVRTEPRNGENETLEWNYFGDKDGNEVAANALGASEWRRVKQMLVFAILPNDLEAFEKELKKVEAGELPDPTKSITPVLFSFRGMSYKAGKDVATFFTQCDSYKIPMWKYQIKVSCKMETNDEGSFYIWQIDRSAPKGVDKKYLDTVTKWADIVTNSADKLKVHEEGEESTYANATHATGEVKASGGAIKSEVC